MKTLVDVSHIIGWSGNLTGIERAEFNIIKYYYESTDAEFICWNEKYAQFQILGREVIRDNIVNRTSEAEQKQSSISKQKHILRKIEGKLRRAKTINSNIPKSPVIILAGLWDNDGFIKGVEELAHDRPIAHIVYDMIPLTQRGYVVDYLPQVFENYMYRILPLCKIIMAISESTARDTKQILEAKGLNVPQISTFRLGDEISRATNAVKPAGIEGDFILSVGTVEARKNHMLLYYSYKQLISHKQDIPKLIIVGKRGWLSSDFQYTIEHDDEVKGKIVILDKITDSELRWFYENCLFTVFPSFYEGWGLPVAESLNYGKVTLSSETSSMTEVGGNFADYFSPYSTDQLSDLIKRYMNKNIRSVREDYIKLNYKPTKWADSTEVFANKIESI